MLLPLLCWPLPALHASVTSGHLSAGAFMATERFSNTDGGSDKNDAQVISARLYLRVSEINNKHWEFITDLRDKEDFFDKTDRERLALTQRNTFQARELQMHYQTTAWAGSIGRFPLREAGSVGVDGALYQRLHTPDWRTGVFGGLNPMRDDQTYYHLNTKDMTFGAHTTYQSRGGDWRRNLYLSHALAAEMHGSETDRAYIFHNSIYQWNSQSRVISLVYFDLVPRAYLQNGNLLWQQYLSQKWSSQLSLLAVDVIAYSRRQGLRETLAASPYREVAGRLGYRFNPTGKFEMGVSTGQREADRLSKTEYYLGVEQSQFRNRHWDVFGKVGARKNFISDDLFVNVYAGYFTRRWEYGLDAEYGTEKYKDGVVRHPITLEMNVATFISRSLYLTASAQHASDETVQILSGFLRIGYRFGSRELAPLRDGSPPRGQL